MGIFRKRQPVREPMILEDFYTRWRQDSQNDALIHESWLWQRVERRLDDKETKYAVAPTIMVFPDVDEEQAHGYAFATDRAILVNVNLDQQNWVTCRALYKNIGFYGPAPFGNDILQIGYVDPDLAGTKAHPNLPDGATAIYLTFPGTLESRDFLKTMEMLLRRSGGLYGSWEDQ